VHRASRVLEQRVAFVSLSEHVLREAELVDQRADTRLMRPEPGGTEVERGPNGRSVRAAPLTREDSTTEATARLRQHDARSALPEHVCGMQSAQPTADDHYSGVHRGDISPMAFVSAPGQGVRGA